MITAQTFELNLSAEAKRLKETSAILWPTHNLPYSLTLQSYINITTYYIRYILSRFRPKVFVSKLLTRYNKYNFHYVGGRKGLALRVNIREKMKRLLVGAFGAFFSLSSFLSSRTPPIETYRIRQSFYFVKDYFSVFINGKIALWSVIIFLIFTGNFVKRWRYWESNPNQQSFVVPRCTILSPPINNILKLLPEARFEPASDRSQKGRFFQLSYPCGSLKLYRYTTNTTDRFRKIINRDYVFQTKEVLTIKKNEQSVLAELLADQTSQGLIPVAIRYRFQPHYFWPQSQKCTVSLDRPAVRSEIVKMQNVGMIFWMQNIHWRLISSLAASHPTFQSSYTKLTFLGFSTLLTEFSHFNTPLFGRSKKDLYTLN